MGNHIILLSCDSRNKFSDFVPNSSLDFAPNIESHNFSRPNSGDSVLYSIVKASDLSVFYYELGQLHSKSYRIFTIKEDRAEMVWIYKDSVRFTRIRGDSTESFYPDKVKNRPLSVLEVCDFIDKLQQYGAFTLTEQDELLVDCNSPIAFDHPPFFILAIYKEGEIRKTFYEDVEKRIKNCSGVSDWQRMANIKKLFDDQW